MDDSRSLVLFVSTDVRIERISEWFPGRGLPPQIYGIKADARGLAWVSISAPAPDAPEGLPPAAETPEQLGAITRQYRQDHIEVFTWDGVLVASARFEDPFETPTPVTAARWYVRKDDLLQTVVILEPVLTAR